MSERIDPRVRPSRPEGSTPEPPRIARIALFTLYGLGLRPAIAGLFAALSGRIGLVVASQRRGGPHGGRLRQGRRHLARSGADFLTFLGLQYSLDEPAAALGRLAGWPCLTLRETARRHGADYLETSAPNGAEVLDRVDAFAPDLIISAGFDRIIRSRLIAVPRHGIINVHSSLLPEYRGVFPVFWALRHRAPRMGASVHLIDSEELDTGPVLEQQVVEPAPGESLMSLDARIFRTGIELAVKAVARLEKGDAVPRPQLPGAGSYHSFPAKEDVTAFRATGRRLYTARDVVRLLRDDERPDRPCQHAPG